MPKKGDNVDEITASSLIDHQKNEVMTYTPFGSTEGGSATKSIGIIYSHGDISTYDAMGNEIIYNQKMATCLISDVPSLARNDLIIIAGEDTKVASYMKVNRYIVRIVLHDR